MSHFLAQSCDLPSSCHAIFQARGTASHPCLTVCISPGADKESSSCWQYDKEALITQTKSGLKWSSTAPSPPLAQRYCLHQGCGCLVVEAVVPSAAGFDHLTLPFGCGSRGTSCGQQTGTDCLWLLMFMLLRGSAARSLGGGWRKQIPSWAIRSVS